LFDIGHFLGLIKALELDLQDRGWHRPYLLFESRPVERHFPPPHTVAGFVHIMLHNPEEWMRHFRRYPRVPVAMIATYLTPSAREWMAERMSERMGLIMTDNRRAGREVAAHLMELGHRRVAFVSHVDTAEHGWAMLRLEGALSVFGEDALTLYSPWQTAEEGDTDTTGADSTDDHLYGHARWYLRNYQALIYKSAMLSQSVLKHNLRATWRYLALRGERRRMKRLFERALRDEGVTAWICVNNELAMLALAYLSSVGRESDIAVIGFDNTTESYKLGLSSYDFSMDRVAHAVMQFLARDMSRAHEERFILVPGRLIPRNSTREHR
jgi:DNA-binding LacI/PurR family transcriptional regulator